MFSPITLELIEKSNACCRLQEWAILDVKLKEENMGLSEVIDKMTTQNVILQLQAVLVSRGLPRGMCPDIQDDHDLILKKILKILFEILPQRKIYFE